MTDPIDIVYLWVDGADPILRRKRLAAMGGAHTLPDDVGGETRYASFDELAWSIASVNRFMPWVHKIYIVTDGQDPSDQLELTRRTFEHPIPVEVVDHSVVFRGYEHVLPVFNCNSIEAVMWRIPGLSDKYIYFNDDMFVLAPMRPEDWFDGDRLIVHGHHLPLWVAEIAERLRTYKGHHALGFKTHMITSAKIAGTTQIPFYYHTPLAQDRRILEAFFAERPDLIEANARHKFRDRSQFNPQVLCNILAEKAGRLIYDRTNTNLFLKPIADRPDYLTRRLAAADRNTTLRLGCISSLDRASGQQRNEFEQWILRRLQISPEAATGPTD